MGYPEINNTNDQTSSNAEVNSSPLDSTSMTDENFNEIYGLTQSNEQVSFLPSDDELLSQLSDTSSNQFTDKSYYQFSDASSNQLSERPAQQYPRSEKSNQKVGPLEYGYVNGEHISITGPGGEYFYKGSDGKWVEHMPPDKERVVENLKVDKDGNMEFEVVGNGTKAHHKRNADGSHSIDSPEHGGKLVYDKNGNLTEAPAGEGHTRKFHYDKDGQLDKIDGRLGQWERKVEDGKVVWVNNKGVRWEGEMRVNPKTNDLEFRGHNGAAWNFTTRGKDVPAYSR
jgi:YD repeat-containing protein